MTPQMSQPGVGDADKTLATQAGRSGFQDEFYQDATEAMSSLPNGVPGAYPQQSFPNWSSPNGNYAPGQYMPQGGPWQNSNFGAPGYPQQMSDPRQGYNNNATGFPSTLPTQNKQNNSTVILVASICCVAVLIGAVVLGTFLFTRNQPSNQQAKQPQPTVVATTAPTPTPTPSPTPTPTPAPTVTPTPPPDAGFAWCNQQCIGNGFQAEYPGTWQVGAAPNANGAQFSNPSQLDQYAVAKAQGATSTDAGTLLNTDLQTNFSTKPGYTAPTGNTSANIGGDTWLQATAYYQGDSQQEQVTVYANIHQGNGYIIELNAPTSQFPTVNGQAFTNVLAKFQFVTPAQ
jgi:hypothetical protein